MRSSFAAGWLTLAMAQPVSGAGLQALEPVGQKKPAHKPPSIDWNRAAVSRTAVDAQPSVVCGMTLVPGDPKVDPKMRNVAVPDRGVTFTMRGVQPTICQTPTQR